MQLFFGDMQGGLISNSNSFLKYASMSQSYKVKNRSDMAT